MVNHNNSALNALGSKSTRLHYPTMFWGTMILLMIDLDLPPYQLPGTCSGESEVHRLHRENPGMFELMPSPHPPSSVLLCCHGVTSHSFTSPRHQVSSFLPANG